MEKEFIPYELALSLKELGFDEEICFGRWTTYPDGEGFLDTTKHSIYQGRDDLNRQCLAPLYQQVFRWFREKHGLFVAPNVISYEGGPYLWFFEINSITLPLGTDLGETDDYKTYEEAELECLKKLIEIVKEQK